MKLLIVGIDGLGWESIQSLGLRKLSHRISQGQVATPSIDNVLSRGWPELYTGKSAFETGAFYQAPEFVDGKIRPTQNTGLTHVKTQISPRELLWNQLMERGHTTAVFGVPTVSVPEELNGFCVAATGAGKIGNSISTEDFFPQDFFRNFSLEGVDLGLRMGYGAFLPNTIEELRRAASQHIDDYFRLLNAAVQTKCVDSLFLGSRFVNEMAYKFLGVCSTDPATDFDRELRSTVLGLCARFDELLDEFIARAAPEHLFVVSDHGIGEFTHDLNLNEILVELGYLSREKYFGHWKNPLRPWHHRFKRSVLRRKTGNLAPRYELEESRAYSIGFTNAIYLNEFVGSIGPSERQDLIEKLLRDLQLFASKHGLLDLISFSEITGFPPVSGGFPTPSIKCHMASGLANTQRESGLLVERDYEFTRMFSEGFYGEHSGCKTEDTIAAYVGTEGSELNLSSLTEIYHTILTIAGQQQQ